MAVDAKNRTRVSWSRPSPEAVRHRIRRRARPSLRPLPAPPSAQSGSTTPSAGTVRVWAPAAASPAEQQHRLEIAARALVRTIRACPAPGVPPLRRRDWLAIFAVVAVTWAVLVVASLVGR